MFIAYNGIPHLRKWDIEILQSLILYETIEIWTNFAFLYPVSHLYRVLVVFIWHHQKYDYANYDQVPPNFGMASVPIL